jgi:hypothetical protein
VEEEEEIEMKWALVASASWCAPYLIEGVGMRNYYTAGWEVDPKRRGKINSSFLFFLSSFLIYSLSSASTIVWDFNILLRLTDLDKLKEGSDDVYINI